MSTANFDQEDVLGMGAQGEPDHEASIFPPGGKGSSSRAGSAPKAEKPKKKGLSQNMWIAIGIVVVLAVAIVWRMPKGKPSADDGLTELTGRTGMELSARPAEGVQQARTSDLSPVEQAGAQQPPMNPPAATQSSVPSEAGLLSTTKADAARPPVEPTNPDAADLAVQPTQTPGGAPEAPAAVPQSQPPVAAATPSAPATPAPQASDATGPASESELAALREEVAQLKSAIADLQKDDLGRRNKPAAAHVTKTRKTTAPAATQAKKRVAKSDAAEVPKGNQPTISGVSLRAVVGDSAWVQTSNGESKQVTTGDLIPGVGVVKAVSANKGEVTLADGRVLR
ncbi:hypothetical protein ACW0US_17890 [Xanthomonas euvesicatoria]